LFLISCLLFATIARVKKKRERRRKTFDGESDRFFRGGKDLMASWLAGWLAGWLAWILEGRN
jgi:hypothetical protein